jgi:peptide-methionine (S)-S-oxide reductase
MDDPARSEKGTFAAGCFWDVEAAFRRVDGVVETVAGYTGGSLPNPDYEQVGTGTTGHVEAVGLIFDPAVVPYDVLLDVFWDMHDPTQECGQGDYEGDQYRSVIFWHTLEQRTAALASRDRLSASGRFGSKPVLTEILPASEFWRAEEHHQRFYEKCGQGYCMSRPVDE